MESDKSGHMVAVYRIFKNSHLDGLPILLPELSELASCVVSIFLFSVNCDPRSIDNETSTTGIQFTWHFSNILITVVWVMNKS